MLETPIQVGSLSLKNRIVKAATVENMATERGEVTDELIRFYEKQARGGAGLLITGGACVQPNGRSVKYVLGGYDDAHMPGLQKLSTAVHKAGGTIVLQIYHCGRQTKPELVNNDVIGPSRVKDRMTGVMPRAMTEHEIEETIKAFGRTAARARETGYDGVEVMAAHGYLISQFLASRTNHRSDKWGGPIENRARFLFRIIEQVKSDAGDSFPVLVKLNTDDKLKKGMTVQDSAWVSERLSGYGADAVKLSGGTFESSLNISRGDIPAEEILEEFSGWTRFKYSLIIKVMRRKFKFSDAYFLENTKQIKPRTNIPVIAVGGLRSPGMMDQMVADGHADLVAVGRPLIRDPDIPNKILAGDLKRFSCINCNRCFIRIIQDKPLRCYAPKQTS